MESKLSMIDRLRFISRVIPLRLALPMSSLCGPPDAGGVRCTERGRAQSIARMITESTEETGRQGQQSSDRRKSMKPVGVPLLSLFPFPP